MLKELYIKTFKLIKYNIILVQPLLIFMLLFGLVINIIAGASKTGPAIIIIILSLVGLFCAFLAGWFNMFHKCVQNSFDENITEKEMAENSPALFKEFTPGVGKYFLKVFVGLIIYVVLFYLFLTFSSYLCEKFIGFPQSVSKTDITQAVFSESKALEVLNKLSKHDKILILKWNLVILFSTGVFSFLTMFWLPAMIAENKNPFSAYLASLVKILQKPFQTLIIFISYWMASTVAIIINALGANNFFFEFIGLILYVFVLIYFITMLFLYYERYSKNNNSGRSDSIG